jgi:hypothetical protein
MACHAQEEIDMAQEAIGKIKALCPARPRTEIKPEPKPDIVESEAAKTNRRVIFKIIVK